MSKLREEVYKKYDGHCAYCGCELEMKDMQVDHIKSKLVARCRKEEVDNSIENLNPSCRQCNYYKGGSGIEGFRKKIAKDLSHTCTNSFQVKLAMKYRMITYTPWDKKFFFEKYEEAKEISQEEDTN